MKAFGYVRVSGKGQVSGDGFDRQELSIRTYAKKHKIDIIKIYYEEGISGTKDETERPAFQEMVTDILTNGVRTVIVESLDRLARELQIQEALMSFLAMKDIDLHSARTEQNITEEFKSDPLRKAMIRIQAVFSELEKDQLVRKLKVARQRKKQQTGKCEGRKGYSDSPEAQEILKEIKRLRRKRNGKHMAYSKVAETMNESGLRSMDGVLFTSNNIRSIIHRQRHS